MGASTFPHYVYLVWDNTLMQSPTLCDLFYCSTCCPYAYDSFFTSLVPIATIYGFHQKHKLPQTWESVTAQIV